MYLHVSTRYSLHIIPLHRCCIPRIRMVTGPQILMVNPCQSPQNFITTRSVNHVNLSDFFMVIPTIMTSAIWSTSKMVIQSIRYDITSTAPPGPICPSQRRMLGCVMPPGGGGGAESPDLGGCRRHGVPGVKPLMRI